jgi:hypothetical protein
LISGTRGRREDVERGEKNASIDNIEKIAKGLRVRASELWAGAER